MHFSDDWLFDEKIFSRSSLDCSTLLFQFIISFTFGQQFEKKRNKIDVLSEEPYPLRRGGATGRANRLMCDDRDDDARDGPALRSSGTRLVCGVPGDRESRVALGCTPTTTYLPSYYYSRAVIRGESRWNPSDRVIVRLTAILFIVITGGKKERKRELQPPLSTLSVWETNIYLRKQPPPPIYLTTLPITINRHGHNSVPSPSTIITTTTITSTTPLWLSLLLVRHAT